jgi:hypothetical protein
MIAGRFACPGVFFLLAYLQDVGKLAASLLTQDARFGFSQANLDINALREMVT